MPTDVDHNYDAFLFISLAIVYHSVVNMGI